MLKRTEKHLEREAKTARRKRSDQVNPLTGVVKTFRHVTERGFELAPGTKFRVASEPGQIFTFKSLSTNRRGEQWIDAYGGDRIRPLHAHRRGFRAFAVPTAVILEPAKKDR